MAGIAIRLTVRAIVREDPVTARAGVGVREVPATVRADPAAVPAVRVGRAAVPGRRAAAVVSNPAAARAMVPGPAEAARIARVIPRAKATPRAVGRLFQHRRHPSLPRRRLNQPRGARRKNQRRPGSLSTRRRRGRGRKRQASRISRDSRNRRRPRVPAALPRYRRQARTRGRRRRSKTAASDPIGGPSMCRTSTRFIRARAGSTCFIGRIIRGR